MRHLLQQPVGYDKGQHLLAGNRWVVLIGKKVLGAEGGQGALTRGGGVSQAV